jgi:hypothetical protein
MSPASPPAAGARRVYVFLYSETADGREVPSGHTIDLPASDAARLVDEKRVGYSDADTVTAHLAPLPDPAGAPTEG